MKEILFRLLNLHHYDRIPPGAVYISRGGKGQKESPLANRIPIGNDDGQGGRIAKGGTLEWYDSWLLARIAAEDRVVLDELDRLEALAWEQEKLELICFCAPKSWTYARALVAPCCHGDLIFRILGGRLEARGARIIDSPQVDLFS